MGSFPCRCEMSIVTQYRYNQRRNQIRTVGRHIIEDVQTSYVKYVLVVYVTTASINFTDTAMTSTCYTDCIHVPFSFLFFFLFFFPNCEVYSSYKNIIRKAREY